MKRSQDGCILAKVCIFCVFVITQRKEQGQYTAILTKQAQPIKNLLCGIKNTIFLAGHCLASSGNQLQHRICSECACIQSVHLCQYKDASLAEQTLEYLPLGFQFLLLLYKAVVLASSVLPWGWSLGSLEDFGQIPNQNFQNSPEITLQKGGRGCPLLVLTDTLRLGTRVIFFS